MVGPDSDALSEAFRNFVGKNVKDLNFYTDDVLKYMMTFWIYRAK